MSCPYEDSYKPETHVCPAMGVQEVTVGVPVEIKPFAHVGKVRTECVYKPIIKRGTTSCEGKPGEVCKFTISQKIRVEVPVMFGAKTKVGEAGIHCGYHDEEQVEDAQQNYEPMAKETFATI